MVEIRRKSKVKETFHITDNSGVSPVVTTYTVDCTICNIQEYSGASTDASAISFEIRCDGAPTAATA